MFLGAILEVDHRILLRKIYYYSPTRKRHVRYPTTSLLALLSSNTAEANVREYVFASASHSLAILESSYA